jgi:hypothetical protein
VAKVNNCVVALDATHTTGGKIAVTTAYSGFTSTLDLTVWQGGY